MWASEGGADTRTSSPGAYARALLPAPYHLSACLKVKLLLRAHWDSFLPALIPLKPVSFSIFRCSTCPSTSSHWRLNPPGCLLPFSLPDLLIISSYEFYSKFLNLSFSFLFSPSQLLLVWPKSPPAFTWTITTASSIISLLHRAIVISQKCRSDTIALHQTYHGSREESKLFSMVYSTRHNLSPTYFSILLFLLPLIRSFIHSCIHYVLRLHSVPLTPHPT